MNGCAADASPAAGPRPFGWLDCILAGLVSVAAFFFWWVLVDPFGSQLLCLAVAMLAGRGAVALLALRAGPREWPTRLGLGLPALRAWAAAALAAPAFLLVLEIQNALFDVSGFEPMRGTLEVAPVALGLDRAGWFAPALLVLVVITPLCSELLFRGLMQPVLVARFGRWRGLLAASAIGAGAHVAVVAFGSVAGHLVLAAALGWNLLLGWIREASGSTLASIATRALANLLLLAAFALAARQPVAGLTAQGVHLPGGLLVAAAVSTAAGLWLLRGAAARG